MRFGDHPDNGKNAYYDPTLYHNGDFVKKEGYCTDIFFNEAWSWILKQKEAKQPPGDELRPENQKDKARGDPAYRQRVLREKGFI